MAPYDANPLSMERIRELLVPFFAPALPTNYQLTSITNYIGLLSKWNAKLNLTAIRDPEEIVRRHFGESLFAATQLFPTVGSGGSAIDVGSGAGFPGLPLKLWATNLQLTLIESNQRKATFLREVIRALVLQSVEVVVERAESVSLRADLVTFRAVEHFERILPVALALVKKGGRIAMLIGEAQLASARSALGGTIWEEPIPVPQTRQGRLLIGHVQ